VRRVLLAEPGQFRVEEVATPEPGPREVVVAVQRAGICGSDVHIYHGVSPVRPPLVLGHEFSGTVHSLGSAVSGWSIGDRLTAEPGIQCGACTYCRSGRYNLCARQYTIGGWRGHDGAYADFVRVPADKLVPLPKGMTFDVGAMVEPVACAMHAMEVGGVRAGEAVLVIGAGTIGQLIAQAARLAGATRVAVADVLPGRLALAARLGANAVANPREEELVDWAVREFGEGGISRVFDTASTPETFEKAVAIVRRGGRIVVVGVPTQPVRWLPLPLLYEIELTGMNMYVRRNFDQALAAIVRGDIQVQPLVSVSYPLDDVEAAYRAVHDQADSLVKVMLAPPLG